MGRRRGSSPLQVLASWAVGDWRVSEWRWSSGARTGVPRADLPGRPVREWRWSSKREQSAVDAGSLARRRLPCRWPLDRAGAVDQCRARAVEQWISDSVPERDGSSGSVDDWTWSVVTWSGGLERRRAERRARRTERPRRRGSHRLGFVSLWRFPVWRICELGFGNLALPCLFA